MDRNNYYGGESASLNLNQVRSFHPPLDPDAAADALRRNPLFDRIAVRAPPLFSLALPHDHRSPPKTKNTTE